MHRSAWALVAVLYWPAVAIANDVVELPGRGAVRPRELLLSVRPGTTGAELRALERRAGIRIVEESTSTGVLRVEVRRGRSLVTAMRRLLHEAAVADVAPNAIARAAQAEVDDPLYYLQWNIGATGAYGGGVPDASNVTVAIVDTGVAADAPDLAGVTIAPGWDFVNDDGDTTDDHQHGTHLAGVVAQATDNGLGTAGMAPGATIMPIKVLDADATGDEFTIMEGISGAVADGAQVLNLSFAFGAGYVPSRAMEATIRDALEDAVLVAAAGNDGNGVVSYPAAFSGVVAVGAAAPGPDGTLGRAAYSNYGPELDLLAPGGSLDVDVYGANGRPDGIPDGILAETFNPADGTFEPYLLEGTSGAAAHASAVAAVLLAAGVAPADVPETLRETATDLGDEGHDMDSGAGLLTLALDEIPVPPKLVVPNAQVSAVRTRDGCTVSATATVTIRDQDGNVIPSAGVLGRWSGSVTQNVTTVTDADGVATVTSPALVFAPDIVIGRRIRRCSVLVDRGTLFMFSVGTVVADDGSSTHPRGNHPDGWFSAWLRPSDGTQMWGAGLVLPPSGVDYVDAKRRGMPRLMDATLLEPFGLVFGLGGRNQQNDLGRIRGAVLNPYEGWVLPVHDVVEADSVVFIGGGTPDPSDIPDVPDLDATWESFSTGVAVFSLGLAAIGGGTPDPSDLPGVLSVQSDAQVMLDALADGTLGTPPVPPATHAARLVPLSQYLDQ
jgi:hypothetical protein